MNPVVVLNNPFLIALLESMKIPLEIGDITMEWPIGGVLTMKILIFPERHHVEAACRAYLESL